MQASVLIPVFNGEKFISECLESILKSDFKGSFEIIIIDDGSTDATNAIVTAFTEKTDKITLHRQENKGIESALNKGIDLCSGEIIIRMDADDTMLPNRISKQVHFLQTNPDIDWTSGRAILMDWNSNVLVPTWQIPDSKVIFDVMDEYNFIIHPTVAIRSRVVRKVGCYRKTIKFKEDVDMWRRLYLANAAFKAINQPLI